MKTYFTLFLISFFSSIFGQTWKIRTPLNNSFVKNGSSFIWEIYPEDKPVLRTTGTCYRYQEDNYWLQEANITCYKCKLDQGYYLIAKIKSNRYLTLEYYDFDNVQIGDDIYLGPPVKY